VFRHPDSGSGDHKSRDSRNIEGPASITARAAGVDQRTGRIHRPRDQPHGSRKARQLADRFPFHAQSYQERRDLRGRSFARKDYLHGRLRILCREVTARGLPGAGTGLAACYISEFEFFRHTNTVTEVGARTFP